MSFLAGNIRHLRAQKSMSQQKVADELFITRARYSKYEDGVSEPPLDILRLIASYFHISIDLLISTDLQKVPVHDLLKLENNRLLMPIIVDRNGENVIEIISERAKAGYLNSYSDPEFIESMQHISLPFLKNGKFRAFPVEGDSMPPHNEGSFIVGMYVESLKDIRYGKTYVILSRTEGIIYKRIQQSDKEEFILYSDNTFYKPYTIRRSDIIEVWEYKCSIATNEFQPDDLGFESIKSMFLELKKDIKQINDKA